MPFRRGGRLKVGVAADLLDLGPGSGHGVVWHKVLRGLRQHVDLIGVAGEHAGRRRLRSRPDVWLWDGHGGAWAPPTAPRVVQIYETGWHDDEAGAFLEPGFAAQIAAQTAEALGACEWVITPAETARASIIDTYAFPEDRVRVVPFGVDLDVFSPAALPAAADVLVRAGADPTRPYVLYVGTLTPRKNLVAVRHAVSALARQGLPHALVIVAGPSPDRRDSSDLEREAFADLPGAPGRIVRVVEPSDPELAALMAGADVLTLPSYFEGFGLPVLEAMACGTPVVVSDRGALPEVVGDAGLVTDPSPDAVEKALAEVIVDRALHDRLAAAARSRAETLTWDATVAGWLAVLEEAARQS